MDGKSVTFGFIVGLIIGTVFTFSIIYTSDPNPWEVRGYKKAYEDMHQGKIEQVVKQKEPALWIKYNEKAVTK